LGTNFQYSKTLACEGAVLIILGLIPYVGWVLGIIGVILLMRSMKEFAAYYGDKMIYENALSGVKYYIVALVAAAVAIAAIVIGVGTATHFTFKGFTLTVGFGVGLAVFFGGLIISFIFFILASALLKKTFDTLAQKSGERSFATAGNLLWWGSILTIIVVGFLLIFIAWIFAIIGFFAMKPQSLASQQYNPPAAQPTVQPQQKARFCQYCGTPVMQDAAYCPACGKQLSP